MTTQENESRHCLHANVSCIHDGYKCSECPVTDLVCEDFYDFVNHVYEEAYELGKIESAVNDCKYAWHDLRKYPNDLPPFNIEVDIAIVSCKDVNYEIGQLRLSEENSSGLEWHTEFWDSPFEDEYVTGWKLREPFEGVEE